MTIPSFQTTILDWYKTNKRDGLPWRATRDPYRILVSEIMLQQTQVSRVIPKYEQFLLEFPNAVSLAQAPENKLLATWSGLGYWRRARFLQEAARAVTKEYSGAFPQTPKELQQLPGVGPYTAGAVACFAFGSAEPFVDTNIRRVYLHFFFPNQENVSDKEILSIAGQAVWKKDPRTWHWALFDYGALELKDKKINKRSRHYAKQSEFEGSFRQFRTKVVRKLLAAPNNTLSRGAVIDFLEDELRAAERDYAPSEIIDALLKDKLIKANRNSFTL